MRGRMSTALPLLLTLAASPGWTQDTLGLEITAQGFDISQPQAGWLGDFGRLRLRFEAEERIAELVIKERSYEVDLANTLEPAHLHLFGTQVRPRNHKDITLDFANYINAKLTSAGQYDFDITLKDKAGRSASATLSVIVNSETTSLETIDEQPDAVDHGVFSFRRIGAGPVVGATDFGITWKTVDASRVTIRITNTEGGASKLLRLVEPPFEAVDSKTQLATSAADAGTTQNIDIPTTSNGAAGETFAVVVEDKPYLLKIKESKTLLSELGTTVILNGEFKY